MQLPDKKYNIIVADPPWDIKFSEDRNRDKRRSTGSPKGTWTAPNINYSTMSLEDIKNLDVKSISDKNSKLFLWVINKYIENSYSVARSWGFKPITMLTWCKTPRGMGLGGVFVQTTEHVLFCSKGSFKYDHRINTTWFNWKRPEKGTGPKHSRKPHQLIELIDEIFPTGSKIELFARERVDGWDTWGDEA